MEHPAVVEFLSNPTTHWMLNFGISYLCIKYVLDAWTKPKEDHNAFANMVNVGIEETMEIITERNETRRIVEDVFQAKKAAETEYVKEN